jgi:succinyl-diaminopimelate desuccinylase
VTSDEEGPAIHGTSVMVDYLQEKGIVVDYCVVGEASSDKVVGDTIKVGRRGSLHGVLTIQGRQGHIAYPDLAKNPIHAAFPILDRLCTAVWDAPSADFPSTSLQCFDIRSGVGASNVIPADLIVKFNFRFSPSSTPSSLKTRVASILDKGQIPYTLDWHLSAKPYWSGAECRLATIARDVIQQCCGIVPVCSTTGGTSDGRFIATLGAQVIELGPINATIHQKNECVALEALLSLEKIYLKLLSNILSHA